jgi:hypothetical protein
MHSALLDDRNYFEYGDLTFQANTKQVNLCDTQWQVVKIIFVHDSHVVQSNEPSNIEAVFKYSANGLQQHFQQIIIINIYKNYLMKVLQ